MQNSEKTDKITASSLKKWAKRKIISLVRMGLCFLREVVYNKLAMDVRAQAHLHRYRQCLTAGEKAIITLRADRGTGPEQGDYKIGKVCYYGRQAPAR
ncbi:MAG: hypothetical protein ACLROS_03920 [Faecalibacterium sp.]